MKTITGIELLQNIKNGYVKENIKIRVLMFDDTFKDLYDVVTVLTFKGNELLWDANTFRVSMLYDDNYCFEIIEEEKKIPEKINLPKKFEIGGCNVRIDSLGFVPTKSAVIDAVLSKMNDIIDYLDYLKSKGDE